MKVLRKCETELVKLSDILVGDQIGIDLNGLGSFTATAQKVTAEGVFFMFDECIAKREMNAKDTNKGGFEKSALRKWIENDVMESFPEDIRAKVKSIALPTCGQMFDGDELEWCRDRFEDDGDEQFELMKNRRNRVADYNGDYSWYWLKNATKKELSAMAFALVNTDGTDRIYFIVSRVVNGVARKMVEVMRDSMLPGNDLAEMHYLDSSLTYRGEGEKATGLAGLDHLEGRTVDVLADGNHVRRVVQNGCIALDYPARVIHAGLGYGAVLETLDMHPPQQPVTARSHSLVSAELHLEKSVSCLAGPIGDEGDEVLRPEDEVGPVLRGGKFRVHLEKAGEDTPGAGFRIRLESDTPYSLCVLAINAVGEAGGQ